MLCTKFITIVYYCCIPARFITIVYNAMSQRCPGLEVKGPLLQVWEFKKAAVGKILLQLRKATQHPPKPPTKVFTIAIREVVGLVGASGAEVVVVAE